MNPECSCWDKPSSGSASRVQGGVIRRKGETLKFFGVWGLYWRFGISPRQPSPENEDRGSKIKSKGREGAFNVF